MYRMSALVLAALAVGCSQKQDVQPVSWYLAHDTERQAKVAWCIDDAERRQLADCLNAEEAKRRALLGSQKNLAPIDWGASKPKP
jgi:hypothetical protein